MKRLIGVFLAILVLSGCWEQGSEFLKGSSSRTPQVIEKLSPRDLLEWQLVGKGEAKEDIQENALVLTEGAGSKGITLVSTRSYGRNVIVTFDVKPLSYEGVNFVFISASDRITGGELKVPDDYNGNMVYWTDGMVQNYIFAFQNGFDESKPFIKKNPGLMDIALAKDLIEGKGSYKVEIGRKGQKLWLKVDGKTVATGVDKWSGGLPDGKIGFRLRGPGAGSYTCLFKNVVIREN